MLVSVIIPFYNSQNTLPRMLDSILRQNRFSDVEFIFIDDGSSDDGLGMVSDFIRKNPAVKARLVSHESNLGVAAAQSTALKIAGGKYITRLDADDWLESDALKLFLIEAASPHDYDIVCFAHFLDRIGKKNKIKKLSSTDLNQMPVDTLSFSLWAKLIRRSLLIDNSIDTIPGVNCWEDVYILSRAFLIAEKISLNPAPVYHYTIDPSKVSVSRQQKDIVLSDRIRYAAEIERWFRINGFSSEYTPFLDRLKFAAKIKFLRSPHRSISLWRQTFPEINPRVMRIRFIPWYIRIAAATLLRLK